MRVFLSWSGERSRLLAAALREWLPLVLQNLRPWLSTTDIERGTRWAAEMTRELSESGVGVLCLTRENLDSTWIHFEAGALSKSLDTSYVCTVLLDIAPTDLTLPLSLFQATRVTRDDVGKLVATLHRASSGSTGAATPLSESQLQEVVDVWWPKLELKIAAIPPTADGASGPVRQDRDVLNEILDTVRGLRKDTAESTAVRTARGRLASFEVSRAEGLAAKELTQRDLEASLKALASLQAELAEAETNGTGDLSRLRELVQSEQGRRASLEARLRKALSREADAEVRVRELQRFLETTPDAG